MSKMLYLAHEPKNGATADATEYDGRVYKPTQPSTYKTYAVPILRSVRFSLLTGSLGHFVSVLSHPHKSFLPLSTVGNAYNTSNEPLPFAQPNLAVIIKQGKHLSAENQATLDELNFTTMSMGNNTLRLKDYATKEDFLSVHEMKETQIYGNVPSRYLDVQSFKAFLIVSALTSTIFSAFHRLAADGTEPKSSVPVTISGYKNLGAEDEPDTSMEDESNVAEGSFTSLSIEDVVKSPFEQMLRQIILVDSSTIGPNSPVAVCNPFTTRKSSFIRSGDMSRITAPGLIVKYSPSLAKAESNFVGDTIGRLFLSCLGNSIEDQFEGLLMLKSGLSKLRTLELGDVFAHMYRCLEIAVDCQSGCVPFFSGSYYEGCVIMGGPGALIQAGTTVHRFQSVEKLKSSFLLVSEHGAALQKIANVAPEDLRPEILAITSMFALRRLCLSMAISEDNKIVVHRAAANLRFSQEVWPINPANLKKVLLAIASPAQNLTEMYPISHLSIFSKDNVLVALSVFGERGVPSWRVPNGIKVSTKTANPPSSATTKKKSNDKKGSSTTDNAAFTMCIRKTDLLSAVSEFKENAAEASFRSVNTAAAKSSGYITYGQDRMAEFWKELRLAYSTVNPSANAEMDDESGKRKGGADGEDSDEEIVISKKPKKQALMF